MLNTIESIQISTSSKKPKSAYIDTMTTSPSEVPRTIIKKIMQRI